MENNNQLPKIIKLFNFAKKERRLTGEYKISSIPRISEIASNQEESIKVDLSFYLENNKTPCIKGIIDLNLILDCQRCLEALPIELRVDFKLAFVRYEQQAEGLDSSYELYLTREEEELLTIDIITDEILLSIPMAPSHDYDCNLIISKDEIVKEKIENPFTVLKNIKIAKDGKE